MNVKNMIAALRSKGHSVGVYHRPDGGVRITSIDGVKYKGSAGGNNAARQILGVSLSAKQKSQRAQAGTQSISGHKLRVYVQKGEKLAAGYHKAAKITKEEKNFLRKYNKAVKELGAPIFERKGQGAKNKSKSIEVPRITSEYFRKGKTRFGAAEEMRRLTNNLRKALGFAYPASVQMAIEKLKLTGRAYPRTIEYLRTHENEINDAYLIAALDLAYDREKQEGSAETEYAIDEATDNAMLETLKEGTKILKSLEKTIKKLKI